MQFEELKRVRELKTRIIALQKNLEELRTSTASLNRVLTGLPSGGGGSSRVESLVVKLVDGERELDELWKEYGSACQKLTDAIMNSGLNSSEQTLLILRHVECLTYRQVARQMNFSPRQTSRLLRCAERQILDQNLPEKDATSCHAMPQHATT